MRLACVHTTRLLATARLPACLPASSPPTASTLSLNLAPFESLASFSSQSPLTRSLASVSPHCSSARCVSVPASAALHTFQLCFTAIMSSASSLRRSTRERRSPAHYDTPGPQSAPPCVALSPSACQLNGGSSDGDDQAAPAHSGKASKAGQRKQQRMASHPYKSAAAAPSVSVCDGSVVKDVNGVGEGGAECDDWSSEWAAKLHKYKESSVSSVSPSAHCTDFDAAATALFDESVCVSPFTMHSLPKLPNVLLPADLLDEVSYSEPLSPVSTSSMEESVFTSMSSIAQSSRSASISSSPAAADGRPRCPYPSSPTALNHHDHVLGRSLYHHPSEDTTATEALNRVFAMLCLAVLCTGVELPSVLEKWQDVYAAFDEFDVAKVSAYGPKEIERLKRTKNVQKDKTKLNAIIHNAAAIQRMETSQPGSFLSLLWSQHTSDAFHADHFPDAERVLPVATPGQLAPSPIYNDHEVDFAAARTAVVTADGFSPSRAILRLKLLLIGVKVKRMGDAACLQFAQSIGLVNHHTRACYCWQHCEDEYQQVIEIRHNH